MRGLKGFSHVLAVWWFNRCDNAVSRGSLVEKNPYASGPDEMGGFATRSPERPNPIAISSVEVVYIDEAAGIVGLEYIHIFPGSPVLDLKAYTPSADRVEHPETPA